MSRCKFCQQEIIWVKEGRRNVPVEMDGSVHKCDEMKKTLGSLKEVSKDSLDQDLIKQYEQSINNKVKK